MVEGLSNNKVLIQGTSKVALLLSLLLTFTYKDLEEIVVIIIIYKRIIILIFNTSFI